MSAWSRCQRCHELLARTTVRAAVQALLRRQCTRPGPFHQVQGHRLGRRLVSTTAEDIEAVSLEANTLRARSSAPNAAHILNLGAENPRAVVSLGFRGEESFRYVMLCLRCLRGELA